MSRHATGSHYFFGEKQNPEVLGSRGLSKLCGEFSDGLKTATLAHGFSKVFKHRDGIFPTDAGIGDRLSVR